MFCSQCQCEQEAGDEDGVLVCIVCGEILDDMPIADQVYYKGSEGESRLVGRQLSQVVTHLPLFTLQQSDSSYINRVVQDLRRDVLGALVDKFQLPLAWSDAVITLLQDSLMGHYPTGGGKAPYRVSSIELETLKTFRRLLGCSWCVAPKNDLLHWLRWPQLYR